MKGNKKPERCQFAEGKPNHCLERPTRKWGDCWFCEEHGSRVSKPQNTQKAAEDLNHGDLKIMKLERGLIIRKEHLDKILEPVDPKVWEMRSAQTSIRGWVGLIEARSGLVVGAAKLVDSLPALDERCVLRNAAKHQVENVGVLVKWRFPWVLQGSFRFQKPVPYVHPMGAVIWVNISDLNIKVGEVA